MIQTVKYQADMETPTIYTGYIVNGNLFVPMDSGNRYYIEIQKWISEGNIPEPAYTQDELDAIKVIEDNAEARQYLDNTDWYSIRKLETGKDIPDNILSLRELARGKVK